MNKNEAPHSKLLVKVCINEWNSETRDKKELAVCRDLGADVKVVAKGNAHDHGRLDQVDGFEVHRISSRPIRVLPVSLNRIISIFTWAKYVHGMHADILSGHDISGLTIAWLSNFFFSKENKAKLVYDSHEFEIGRNVKRNKFQIWMVKTWERFLINKSEFMIVVNDSIADEVVKIHKLKERPVVVRNIPPRWDVDVEECKRIRRQFFDDFGKEATGEFIVMYHGGLLPGRGIETLINLLQKNKKINGVILGNGQNEYVNNLKRQAQELGVTDRLHFHKAVKHGELWKYVGAADVGMILAPASTKNMLFSLPNKFFENIHSGTPIICPYYPEMKRLVDEYEIGLTCNPEDLEEINSCVERLRNEKELYSEIKRNVMNAQKVLSWESEKSILGESYRRLI